jgi:hypothetical protein
MVKNREISLAGGMDEGKAIVLIGAIVGLGG